MSKFARARVRFVGFVRDRGKTTAKKKRTKLAALAEELRGRGQKNTRITWDYMDRLARRRLPSPRITPPYPNARRRTS